jgi:hypothetical protein
MPFDDPDPKFERALAQHLRGGSAQANCPDAETLAAYHERNLSLEEMARWKEHISACEACQEALALVETTENQLSEDWKEKEIPVLEAASILGAHAGEIPKRSAKAAASGESQAARSPVAILRQRPPLLRWAIPLGAVAAGVLVFIGIYEQRGEKKLNRSANTEVARNQTPPAPGPIADQLENKLSAKQEGNDLQLNSGETSKPEREPKLPAAQLARPMAKAKDSDNEVRESGDQLAGGSLRKKTLSPTAPAPSLSRKASTDTAVYQNAPAIAAAPPGGPPPAPAMLGGSAGGVAPRPPARADAKNVPPAASQTVTVESAAPPIDTASSMMKQGINGRNVTSLNTLASGSEFILSPDNKVWWKLGPGGTVELTTDGGKKWKSLDTGAISQLTRGAAPSSKVCWIAGNAGTLVLTLDRGGHWARISTPITGDLGGVHAADAKHASIWDAANQISYETFDGGATWKQTSGK